jgi:hypothetical protein
MTQRVVDAKLPGIAKAADPPRSAPDGSANFRLWPPSANNAQAVVMSVVSGTPYDGCADRSF